MDLCRTELVTVVFRDILVDEELVKEPLNVLEVGHVSACADDRVLAYGGETGDVLEPCERAVRS